MKSLYPIEIVFEGKTYVHGPVLPPEECKLPVKCQKCAGRALGKCAFGWECLVADNVYWIKKPAEAPSDGRNESAIVVCEHCGTRHRVRNTRRVQVSETRSELWCSACVVGDADICTRCGGIHAKALLELVGDSGTWCPECRERWAVRCDHCGSFAPRGEGGEVHVRPTDPTDEASAVAPRQQHWCASCLHGTVVCDRCGGRVPTENSVRVDDAAQWCAVCADAFAYECPECGRMSASLVDSPSRDGRRICPGCADRLEKATIYNYHGFHRALKFWGAGTGSSPVLFLGFELEAGGATSDQCRRAARAVHNINPCEDRFHLEHDGSIPDYGFELVSAPHTLAEHASYDWKAVTGAMSGNGLRSHDLNGLCGLHVHVSRNFFSTEDLVRLDLFVLKNKEFWEKVARRTETHFAAFIKKPAEELGRSGEGRYAAINFCPEKTVEFRLFRGTLNYRTLMATLELVDGVCRWIKAQNSEAVCRNERAVDAFVAWLVNGGPTYARAVEYIALRRAFTNANEGTGDLSDPLAAK